MISLSDFLRKKNEKRTLRERTNASIGETSPSTSGTEVSEAVKTPVRTATSIPQYSASVSPSSGRGGSDSDAHMYTPPHHSEVRSAPRSFSGAMQIPRRRPKSTSILLPSPCTDLSDIDFTPVLSPREHQEKLSTPRGLHESLSSNGSMEETASPISSAVLSPSSFIHIKDGFEEDIQVLDEYIDLSLTWSHDKLLDPRVRHLISRGIPSIIRGRLWKKMTNANDFLRKNPGVYDLLLSSPEPPSQSRVISDLGRTFPEHTIFSDGGTGQKLLNDLLKAYSLFDQTTNYCQGMNFVAGILLMHMNPEDAFWAFVQIMKTYGLVEIFQPGTRGMRLLMFQFDSLLELYLPKLFKHFKSFGIQASLYVSQWFVTIYSYDFPLDVVCRIWDIYLAERDLSIVIKVALSLMAYHESKILKLDFEGIVDYMRNIPSNLPEVDALIRVAQSVKWKHKLTKLIEAKFEATQ